MKCSRPTCDRVIRSHGLCRQHSDLYLKQHGLTLVPAAPVADHIARLRAANLGWKRIGELAGVPMRRIREVTQQKQLRVRTAQKILAVPVPVALHRVLPDKARVPITGTRRRLQGLCYLGYTHKQIADAISYPVSQLSYLLLDDLKKTVEARTAKRVEAVFNEWQIKPAPEGTSALRARKVAIKRGWIHPLNWDEESIDDPNAEPYRAKKYGDTGWHDTYLALRTYGYTNGQIAERMGIHRDTLQKRLERLRSSEALAA